MKKLIVITALILAGVGSSASECEAGKSGTGANPAIVVAHRHGTEKVAGHDYDKYELQIKDPNTGETKWVRVDLTSYNKCKNGKKYPDCTY